MVSGVDDTMIGFKSLAVSNRQPLNEIRIKISAISIGVNIVYLKTFEKKTQTFSDIKYKFMQIIVFVHLKTRFQFKSLYRQHMNTYTLTYAYKHTLKHVQFIAVYCI